MTNSVLRKFHNQRGVYILSIGEINALSLNSIKI